MAGDKGIKCPSASLKQCKRDRQGRHRLPRWQSCQRRLPPRTPSCAASCHVCLGESWSDTLAGMLDAGTKWGFPTASSLPRSSSCRVWELVAHRALPGCRARRGKLSWYALSGLPGKLLLPGSCLFPARSSCWGLGWPSRQAPLAEALVGLPGKLLLPGPWFEYFVLEWSSREPRRVLAVTRQALPRGAATARARVRGNRVPLL